VESSTHHEGVNWLAGYVTFPNSARIAVDSYRQRPHFPEVTIMRILRATLIVIGIIQISCGAMYLVTPGAVAGSLQLQPAAAPWVNWLLATAGARFIGYGIGMFAAARAPSRHPVWINTMIAIQAVDFLATLGYLANGVLPAHHFALTLWLPLLWVVLLSWASLRSRTAAEPDSVDRQTAASGSKSRP
jgi:hypothetical protein